MIITQINILNSSYQVDECECWNVLMQDDVIPIDMTRIITEQHAIYLILLSCHSTVTVIKFHIYDNYSKVKLNHIINT